MIFLGAGCGEDNQKTVNLNQTAPVLQMDDKKEETDEENMDTATVINEKKHAVERSLEAESLTYDYQADLEPRDGDTAPADYVVEGDLVASEFTVEK